MPSRSKVLGNGAVGRQKTLGMPRRLKPLHTIFPLARWSMRILTAVVEIATLPVFHAGQDLALRGAVALELVRNDYTRHVLQALQQLAKKLLRRLLIPPALHEDIQHVIVLVDSAPKVMALPVDGQEHLVEVPFVAWLGAATLQPIRIILPKLQTPLADGLVGHVDAALEQEFLYITVAQREAIVEPDPVTDDFTGKAVVLIAVGVSG